MSLLTVTIQLTTPFWGYQQITDLNHFSSFADNLYANYVRSTLVDAGLMSMTSDIGSDFSCSPQSCPGTTDETVIPKNDIFWTPKDNFAARTDLGMAIGVDADWLTVINKRMHVVRQSCGDTKCTTFFNDYVTWHGILEANSSFPPPLVPKLESFAGNTHTQVQAYRKRLLDFSTPDDVVHSTVSGLILMVGAANQTISGLFDYEKIVDNEYALYLARQTRGAQIAAMVFEFLVGFIAGPELFEVGLEASFVEGFATLLRLGVNSLKGLPGVEHLVQFSQKLFDELKNVVQGAGDFRKFLDDLASLGAYLPEWMKSIASLARKAWDKAGGCLECVLGHAASQAIQQFLPTLPDPADGSGDSSIQTRDWSNDDDSRYLSRRIPTLSGNDILLDYVRDASDLKKDYNERFKQALQRNPAEDLIWEEGTVEPISLNDLKAKNPAGTPLNTLLAGLDVEHYIEPQFIMASFVREMQVSWGFTSTNAMGVDEAVLSEDPNYKDFAARYFNHRNNGGHWSQDFIEFINRPYEPGRPGNCLAMMAHRPNALKARILAPNAVDSYNDDDVKMLLGYRDVFEASHDLNAIELELSGFVQEMDRNYRAFLVAYVNDPTKPEAVKVYLRDKADYTLQWRDAFGNLKQGERKPFEQQYRDILENTKQRTDEDLFLFLKKLSE
ncbi:hypothetical protein HDU76_005580 [Blyttiomyces sp. JEL0837]|nr:hypothetical protein HDU76_005580 [Blyttiomyces sp. JEL0837]